MPDAHCHLRISLERRLADHASTEPLTDEPVAAYDILIVGSGPAGSTYARELRDALPEASILMVDSGPRLTSPAGTNVRNLSVEERGVAQRLSEGPTHAAPDGPVVARPGTHLVREFTGSSLQEGMPAAAMSTNVGGMGAHWTCACPPPSGSEKVDFIDDATQERAFDEARRLLHVTQEGFPVAPTTQAVQAVLSSLYDGERAPALRVQPMPLACEPSGSALPVWSGAGTILGDLAADASGSGFELRERSTCVRLLTDGDAVVGAEIRDLATGVVSTVRATWVVVAADSLRTPQLLWASGIRPTALGHYLNDQPQVVSAIELEADKVDVRNSETAAGADLVDIRDQLTGVLWIPFDDASHPFHGQIMQMEAAPIAVEGLVDPENRHLVTFGWFLPKELSFDDAVEFSSDEVDAFGLPAMAIRYSLTEEDERNVAEAIADIDRAVESLGHYAEGGHARLLPAGSSLHYQGTYRMGPIDDGSSVCDPWSRVWGYRNLYLGGNGLIPTATACNPTLTSVSFAVLGAENLVQAAKNA
ncbi:GMC oxidoreductase [Leifsonia sp. NPDC058194]|uniref:GMC oxidoreductase n=1 Tax=Leifsonia sp. NPDC058194 TaxID=3346374 RepID=UPI0036DE95A6